MISAFGWFWIIYYSIGLLLMMEALVESWEWKQYPTWMRILGGFISVSVWPLLFFMN